MSVNVWPDSVVKHRSSANVATGGEYHDAMEELIERSRGRKQTLSVLETTEGRWEVPDERPIPGES